MTGSLAFAGSLNGGAGTTEEQQSRKQRALAARPLLWRVTKRNEGTAVLRRCHRSSGPGSFLSVTLLHAELRADAMGCRQHWANPELFGRPALTGLSKPTSQC